MTPNDPWLGAVWSFVRDQLPPAPVRVLEVGCGSLGGFVPALLDAGYHAVGVDPEAPEGPGYLQIEFERYKPPQPVDCVVASLSLHHVADLDAVMDRLGALLVPGGALVVVEWAWEQFDEATARWCFARLAHQIQGRSRAGCTRARSDGRPLASPGMTSFGPGRPRRGCTPARTSCGAWMRAFTVSCMWRGRTSSPIWPTPARARSRPRSMLA